MRRALPPIGCILFLATACASTSDRFYTLSVLPAGAAARISASPLHVLLDVTIPAIVDRSEMVLQTPGNRILILDHERWAASLSEQVSQTLARDIEGGRGDILVGDRGFTQTSREPVSVRVDLVTMSVQRAVSARIEAHWRIVERGAGVDRIGNAAFDTPVSGISYESVAQAYSQVLSALAARLTEELRRR